MGLLDLHQGTCANCLVARCKIREILSRGSSRRLRFRFCHGTHFYHSGAIPEATSKNLIHGPRVPFRPQAWLHAAGTLQASLTSALRVCVILQRQRNPRQSRIPSSSRRVRHDPDTKLGKNQNCVGSGPPRPEFKAVKPRARSPPTSVPCRRRDSLQS